MPAVFLTIDTELAWRHHSAGHDLSGIYARSVEPAGVGLSWQLGVLARAGLKATFFVDPMPALVHGTGWLRRMVGTVLDAGQEVQLHCHAQWDGASAGDRTTHGAFELIDLSPSAQRDMLARARDMLVAAGAPTPVAFRAGSYSADDATLAALTAIGIAFDSSHNGAHHPWPSAIGLPPARIAPVVRGGLIEVPVTVIEDTPGRWRNVQICALSLAEMRAALRHAIAEDHACLTIVGHSFEIANRAGTRSNRIHQRRFEALCATLATFADEAPTAHFADRPPLPLDRADRPLRPAAWRRRWRQAEQAWSTLVEERA